MDGHVALSVEVTGPVIAKVDQERIYERFVRVADGGGEYGARSAYRADDRGSAPRHRHLHEHARIRHQIPRRVRSSTWMRGRWQKEKERILSAHRARLESYNVELTSTSTAMPFLTVDRLYSSAIHAWTALLTTP
ncbi:MAG TPA: hypothetical protein VNO31_03480 [Umezawaea sp.]|nr:hypothetical protein [Umezawaea sp.]